jgi:hypothetical protein
MNIVNFCMTPIEGHERADYGAAERGWFEILGHRSVSGKLLTLCWGSEAARKYPLS